MNRSRIRLRIALLALLFGLLHAAPALAILVGFHEQAATGANANSITVAVPAGSRVGDVMLAAVTVRNAPTVTAPAGWVALLNTASGANLRTVVYYRVVATEPANYTWTFSASNRAAAAIVTYRGVDTGNPVDVSGGQANASSASITAPSVTTTVANARLVGFFSTRQTSAVTPPGGMSERSDVNSGGTGATLEVTDEPDITPGGTGARVATAGAAGVNVGQLVALRPAATVPAPVLWYRMDEAAWSGAAGEVLDSGSAGLDGTALGGATTAAGIRCRAGSFSGSPTRVDVAHNSAMTAQSTFTVTAWLRPNVWPASELMSFLSKDENFEFHVATNGRLNWWWNDGSAQLFSPNGTVPINQWTFVAFVFTRGAQTVYAGNATTAVTVRVSGTNAAQLLTNTDKLQIGDDQDFGGGARRWNGLIDDVRVYDAALTQAEVDAIRSAVSPCGADHYRVTHATTGVNCQAENVTIAAHDSAHAVVTLTNSTTITVTAQYVSGAGGPGNRGDWTLVSGGGTLANGAADDGVATYTFAAGGETTVVIALKDTWAQTVNIAVTDGSTTDTSGTASADAGFNQNLAFSAAGFRFIDAANNTLPNQVAGVSSATLYLQAIQSSTCSATGACTGVCTVAPGFASGTSVSVELASQCVNPTTCQAGQQVSITNNGTSAIAANNNGSVSAYTSKSLLFGANGMAAFTLSYPDVGAIGLHARYTIPLGTGAASSNLMTGASNTFVVKPYSFQVSNLLRDSDAFANPGAANAAGAVFIRAGDAFRATVTAVNFAGSPTPNYGKETAAEGARLLSTLVGGLGLTNNPALANATAFGAFNAGAASGTTFGWSEAGIITLSAGVGDGDYLGAGDAAVFTQSGNVGRFMPHHFVMSGPSLVNRVAAGCSVPSPFTYLGEGMGLGFTLTAVDAAGTSTTQNYATGNGFAKLPTTPGTVAPASTLGYAARSGLTNLTGRLDTSVTNTITWSGGQAAVSATIAVSRAAAPDGPYTGLNVGIAPSDQDGVTLAASAYNLDVDGLGGNDHALVGVTEARFGRLRAFNAVGTQLFDLPVPLETQYYNGVGFITNGEDDCTTLAKNAVIFTNFQRNLAACETGSSNPPGSLTFSRGKARLVLAKPGPGAGADTNAGSVDLKPRLSSAEIGNTCVNATSGAASDANQPWLQFQWSGSGAYDQNPAARASFGQARNSPEFIYFRENY